jgi:hypothetical protein
MSTEPCNTDESLQVVHAKPNVEGKRCWQRPVVWVSVALVVLLTAGLITNLVVSHHADDAVDPRTCSVVKALNAKFEMNSSGLLLHFNDGFEQKDEPWLADTARGFSSFIVLNHFAWNGTDISLFLEAQGLWGYIGSDQALSEMTDCLYPQDGYSTQRTNFGCGCQTKVAPPFPAQICQQPKEANWCEDFNPNTTGDGCAYRPNGVELMLKKFHESHKAKCTSGEGIFCYNEAVVNAEKWNAAPKQSLKAFVLPIGAKSKCGPETKCYKEFFNMYRNYRGSNGFLPILGLDVTQRNKPFDSYMSPKCTDASASKLLVV